MTPVVWQSCPPYHACSSALDTATNQKVAVKKIHHAFATCTDARRTLREVLLLQHLQHENVIRCMETLVSRKPQVSLVIAVKQSWHPE